MCKRAGETTNHLLLCCLVARELWCMVFTLFGVHLVMPSGVMELLSSWPGKFSKHRNGFVWNIIPHCLMCGIWWERNARIFEGTESSNSRPETNFFSILCLGGQRLQVFPLLISYLLCLIVVLFMHLNLP